MLGVSTACFYPLEVEKALQFICESGVKTTEIFFNSPSELNRDFLNSIKAAAENFGTNIKAIHPLSSFAEPYMLFSEYNRRFSDTRELYKKYYETAAMLDADYVIIHGDTRINGIEDNDYFERFFRLMEDGSEYGIQVVQENVNKHRSADPKFLAKMKLQLGDALKFTFDVKQSMRAGFSVDDFLEAIGKDIVHIHISDQGDRGDCLLPGDGTFDFSHLFQRMNAFKFSGDYIFEVYRECYKKHEDVIKKYNKYIKMWYNDI